MQKQGIYKILNNFNGKVYIGQVCLAKGHKNRWGEHKKALSNNRHYNGHLQAAWNKYGENNFQFLMIEEVDDINKLDEREQFWLDQTKDFHYNIQKMVGSFRGVKKNLSREAKYNIATANKSRPWTKEDRQKQSVALTGIKRSDEFKDKQRKRMLGTKQSEEIKMKKSIALKGRVFSEETIAKMHKARLKYFANCTDEVRNKLRADNFGVIRPKKDGRFKGVSKHGKAWRARLLYLGKEILLGRFETTEQAARNYDYYAIMFHGNRAVLNYPEYDYSSFQPGKQINVDKKIMEIKESLPSFLVNSR